MVKSPTTSASTKGLIDGPDHRELYTQQDGTVAEGTMARTESGVCVRRKIEVDPGETNLPVKQRVMLFKPPF